MTVKLQTGPHQSLFKRGATKPNEDKESSIPINVTDKAPPTIPFVELDDSPVASDIASIAESYNPNEPDPEHLCQSNHTWECQSGHFHRTHKVTCTFGPKQIPIHTA